ncbi:MAG: hypothetical protein V1729_04725 [Candidatus Woesearchaeota archaeon]
MKKESDVSKTLALVLIILTVMISATSTWVLITNSMSPQPEQSGLNKVMILLHIIKGPVNEPMQTDYNSGDVKLFISDNGG